MLKRLLSIICTTIILYSCSNNGSNNDIIFDKPFPSVSSLNVSETLPIQLLNTHGIILSDAYIVSHSSDDEKMIKVFDRANYNLKGEFLTKGKGDDEVLFLALPIQWEKSNGKLKILIHSFPNYMNWLDVDSSLIVGKTVFGKRNKFKTYKQKDLIINSGSSYDLGNDIVLMRYNKNLEEDNINPLMLFYDLKNDCEIGRMTWSDLKKSDYINDSAFGGNTSISDDKKTIAQAYFDLNLITFYNLEAKTKRKIFFSKEATNYRKAQEDIYNPEHESFYKACRGSENYFFALKNPTKEQKENGIMSLIQLFDWQGEPKYEFLIKEDIIRFDIDENTKQLYATVQNDNELQDQRIVVYNLPI